MRESEQYNIRQFGITFPLLWFLVELFNYLTGMNYRTCSRGAFGLCPVLRSYIAR